MQQGIERWLSCFQLLVTVRLVPVCPSFQDKMKLFFSRLKPTLHYWKLRMSKTKSKNKVPLKTPHLLSLRFIGGFLFGIRNLTYKSEGGYNLLKKKIVSSCWDILSQHFTSGILWQKSVSLNVCFPLKGWNTKQWDDRMFLTWVLVFHTLNSTVRGSNLE